MKKTITLLLCLLLLCCALFFASCGFITIERGHTHAWSDWKIVSSATCVTEGEETRTCSCGESETQPIPATGVHTYGTDGTCLDCDKTLPYTKGLSYTEYANGSAYEVSGIGTATDTNIVIPYYYNGKPVMRIGKKAFANCSTLTDITIPASVVIIDDEAFRECFGLKSVTFDEGSCCTSIGSLAFATCVNLTSITIPASISSIGADAFDTCHKLIEVYNLSGLWITAGSEEHGGVGFNAKNVYIASSGASKLFVDDNGYQFYKNGNDCYLMSYVGTDTVLTLPADYSGSSYAIYKYAFCNRADITSITIPSGISNISYNTFYKCTNLTSVTIPASVTNIEMLAFWDCQNLSSVNFQGTVAQWKVAAKNLWNYNGGDYTVTCTDGTIDKNGIVTMN